MQRTKNSKMLLAMVECSIMIALSTVLSFIKIIDLPYGGSVTIASMLPIIVAAYRHGGGWAIGTALVNSLIQMLLGLSNFSYFSTWQSFVALALFDYVIAFTVFAIAPAFKKIIKSQNLAMLLGTLIACLLRYACHVISGATIWAGLSIPDEAALLYSLSYNATYMIPDTIILCLVTAYVFSVLDFSREMPRRIKEEAINRTAAYLYMGAGLVTLGVLIADVVMVFSKLQNAVSGEIFAAGLGEVNWLAVGITSGVGAVLTALLFLFGKRCEAREAL